MMEIHMVELSQNLLQQFFTIMEIRKIRVIRLILKESFRLIDLSLILTEQFQENSKCRINKNSRTNRR